MDHVADRQPVPARRLDPGARLDQRAGGAASAAAPASRPRRSLVRAIAAADPVLLVVLGLSLLFCLHGIAIKYMHPDQMALLPLFHEGRWPFNPGWFEKPPFHAYCNYFLAVLPISGAGAALSLEPDTVAAATVVWSRMLMTALVLGSIVLVFTTARKAFGTFAARVISAVFATSAGIVAHAHFLTADVPVMFWMLLAFHFCQRIVDAGRTSDYVWAGFFTGIATATKYNGLAVGLAIPAAHVLATVPRSPGAFLRTQLAAWKPLALGLAMVVVGFLAGNPFAVLDYETFKADFLYNYMVAPVYEGQSGHGFLTFFACITEIIGIPAFVVFVLASVVSIYLIAVRREPRRIAWATTVLTAALCALYYVKMGTFPRLPTRFVLPIVPFCLLLSGAFWAAIEARRSFARPAIAVVIALVLYNAACSHYVGLRFADDPRLDAEAWLRAHVPQDSAIEADIYAGDWSVGMGPSVRHTIGPFVTGRERLFARIFPGNRFITGSDEDMRAAEAMVQWYSIPALTARDPDFIAMDSLYYDRFVEPGMRRDLYPEMVAFYDALLTGRSAYRIAFERESTAVPRWIYPRDLDFTHHRATVLAKSSD